jgi:hypothetical protein
VRAGGVAACRPRTHFTAMNVKSVWSAVLAFFSGLWPPKLSEGTYILERVSLRRRAGGCRCDGRCARCQVPRCRCMHDLCCSATAILQVKLRAAVEHAPCCVQYICAEGAWPDMWKIAIRALDDYNACGVQAAMRTAAQYLRCCNGSDVEMTAYQHGCGACKGCWPVAENDLCCDNQHARDLATMCSWSCAISSPKTFCNLQRRQP